MLSDGEIFLLSIYHSYSLILVNGKERGRFFGRGVGIGVGHVFGCGGAAGNLLGLDVWLDFFPFFIQISHAFLFLVITAARGHGGLHC